MQTLVDHKNRERKIYVFPVMFFSVGGVSLVGGTGSYEGRVVVHIDSIAGTVCDDEFDDVEAGITCRMLGFR